MPFPSFRVLPLLAVLLTSPAMADGFFPGGLAASDQRRLQGFEESRRAAIAAARQGGSAAERAELEKVLAGEAVALTPAQLAGDWRCRKLLLGGGGLPLVIYGDFRCRITDDSAGLQLRKLTGSQRSAGSFYDTGGPRLGFAGAEAWGSPGSEAVPRYGQDPQRDQVGYLVPVAPDRLRLELPRPRHAAGFEILELRR